MNIKNCIDEECIGGCKNRSLAATTYEEMELIDSIHKLLYKTKSVRKTIDILDKINSEIGIYDYQLEEIEKRLNFAVHASKEFAKKLNG